MLLSYGDKLFIIHKIQRTFNTPRKNPIGLAYGVCVSRRIFKSLAFLIKASLNL